MNETMNPELRTTARAPKQMLELDRTECLKLLASASVGRVAVTVSDWDQPVIRPVNYLFDERSQSVLIRTGDGTKLHALIRSTHAAFEVDETDPVGQIGWSVIIHGVCEEITNLSELKRINALGLEPWAPGEKGDWIRIRTNVVSGRQLVATRHAALTK